VHAASCPRGTPEFRQSRVGKSAANFLDSFFLHHHGLAFSAAKVGMISDCGGGFEP